jgi:ribulose-phosphate 3-epimerase
MRTCRLAASLLAADLGRLEQEVQRVEKAMVDSIHIDVMDGHFVPYFALRTIRDMGCQAALAINPMTLVEKTYSLLDEVDQLLCMSVNPGGMGQPFIIEVLEKVRLAQAYRDKNHLSYNISIDGGVTDETIGPCVTAGANQVVVGRPIFTQKDACDATRLLRARANEVGAGG